MRRLIGPLMVMLALTGCERFRPHAEPAPAAPKAPKEKTKTTMSCGRCSHRFRGGWAATAVCPKCGFKQLSKYARRHHGPPRYSD